jgi:hypothetical protein
MIDYRDLCVICEACERAAVEMVESCDNPKEPYHLCPACHRRLRARALRPLEWYNLAKRHGWYQFLLHDDFYLQDGTAGQPETDVERPADFPAPILAGVAHDTQLLLDYSITRWHLDAGVEAAWETLSRPEVLATLRQRFSATSNAGIRARILEICAMALRESGADFVRSVWGEYPATVDLVPLTQASAACLPFREGFHRVTTALAALEHSRQRDVRWALAYFHSIEVLDWIEQHISKPITDEWGRLAAASALDWPRVERWLEHGRPLSLVALDGLAEIARPQSPLLRRLRPKLGHPPTFKRFMQMLSGYAARDNVPRVEQRTRWLISQASILTTPDY